MKVLKSIALKVMLLVACVVLPAQKLTAGTPFNKPMYFATTADMEHYPWLIELLKTIAEFHKGKETLTLIFDIGLEKNQIKFIESNYKAKVYPIEMVHPDLTKKFKVRTNGRVARGWYAWKPVAMKQAFDHVPYFLYIDSSIRLAGPVDDIFNIITQEGYFLIECGHKIAPVTTKRVKKKFDLDKAENKTILEQLGMSAGLQGLSKKVFKDYIKPVYEFAHDLSLFEDDGTAPMGFGFSRHDQTIFSVQARKLGYLIHRAYDKGPAGIFLNKQGERSFNLERYFVLKHKQMEINPDAAKYNLIG